MTTVAIDPSRRLPSWINPGLIWLGLGLLGASLFFVDGLRALLDAWALPEYSHGPLIPILSGFLFLRQLRSVPVDLGPKHHRWVGVTVIGLSLILAAIGKLSNIYEFTAYAIILWIGGILLISFGWKTGKHFWPPVLHLVYMLPLPGILYFKLTTWLQFISSELGVLLLNLLSIPVFLDGNIIDLGVVKLHVAEACSGLRYLFPILSFSYIFAVLYKGPIWHKATLLIAAAPITVLMNSVRIAVAGVIVQYYGIDWLEGFTHFFEGWVIFLSCILILFALARTMLFFNRKKLGLAEALDLEIHGLVTQASRIQFVKASGALILASNLTLVASLGWQLVPEHDNSVVARSSFDSFPKRIGHWQQVGSRKVLSSAIAKVLGADDYHSVTFYKNDVAAPVEFFSAWYFDQSRGGIHSPEICLPGNGWEIAWLEQTELSSEFGWETPFWINRAIIQKGETRMMVYYWFDQKGRKIAWDVAAKYWLLIDAVRTGRTDGALVRLTTPILTNETDEEAEARLLDVLHATKPALKRFIPG